MNKVKQLIRIIIVSVLIFIFCEGLASTIVILRDLIRPVTPDLIYIWHHIDYDKLLGWINAPNLKIKDYYGKGIFLETNAQRFRESKSFSTEIQKGKIRIICCGDSFTFGHGVDNIHTWCKRLASLDKRLETINMGQSGYGIDQAYLWYMRDGVKLKHNIHILAFITDDFYRMSVSKFEGYDKPLLEIGTNSILVNNVPVPKDTYLFPQSSIYKERLSRSGIYEFVKRISWKIFILNKEEDTRRQGKNLRQLALKIFETLYKVNKENGSTFVLAYLPDMDCAYEEAKVNAWRKWLGSETAKRGILYLDLYNDFLKLPVGEAQSLFIPNDGHPSNKGHEFIAQSIYKKLVALHKI